MTYERIETELKGVIELYDQPLIDRFTDGVMMRMSVNSNTDRRTVEIYLDPVSQKELAMALLDNLKE